MDRWVTSPTEKYETANWSLRQGDEEVNKRIKENLFKYIFFSFILLFTSSSPCRKDQFAVSYFSTSLIVLSQVYNWEIRHHSLVCYCGLSDVLYILEFTSPTWGPLPPCKQALKTVPLGPTLSFRLRACLSGGGGRQIGEVTCGGSPHLSCKRDQIKIRYYMDRYIYIIYIFMELFLKLNNII